MPVVSQSISKPIVPVGASTVACELRTPNARPSSTASSHDCCAAPSSSSAGTSSSSIFAASAAVHAQHAQHVLAVLGVAGERAHARRPSRADVAYAWPVMSAVMRAGPRAAGVGVVRQAERHEQRAEVGVAETELTEPARRVGDLLGRVVGVADEDLLRGEHDLDGGLEALDVERAVVVEELQQVEAGEVARRVVEVHVLAARVAAVDAAGVRRRVPTVDRRVELHAGVGALPRGLGDLAQEFARLDRLDDLARR